MSPLASLKVIEMVGQGPAPFCGMLLADLGADVIRIDRPGVSASSVERFDLMRRGKRTVCVDLKTPPGTQFVRDLCGAADVLIEGFRPGVMERLGLGPQACLEVNPRLIYGRMTGWGQSGPLATRAGHDINYIALTGALHAIGRRGEAPVPPLNLVGDFGGGGMLLALGVLAALVERERSGTGQVVDAAMVDGAAVLMTMFYGLKARGDWADQRGVNFLDSGAHYYDTYETADRRHLAVGAIEKPFRDQLMQGLGLASAPGAASSQQGEDLAAQIARTIARQSRDDWTARFESTDACVTPVLSMEEAPRHAHNTARQTFVEVDGVIQPAPAPRFSRSSCEIRHGAAAAAECDLATIERWGIDLATVQRLAEQGCIALRLPRAEAEFQPKGEKTC